MSFELSETARDILVTSLTYTAAGAWTLAFKTYFENNPNWKDKGPWYYAITVSVIAIIAVYMIKESVKEIKKVNNNN